MCTVFDMKNLFLYMLIVLSLINLQSAVAAKPKPSKRTTTADPAVPRSKTLNRMRSKKGTTTTEAENVCKSVFCRRTARIFKTNINPDGKACIDFYEYACGGFSNAHPLPPYSSVLHATQHREDEITAKILQMIDDECTEPVTTFQKIRHFYESCLDEKSIQTKGLKTIEREMTRMCLPLRPPFDLRINEKNDYMRMLAELHRNSLAANFLFSVSVQADQNDATINRLTIGDAPSSTRASMLDWMELSANNFVRLNQRFGGGDFESLTSNSPTVRAKMLDYVRQTTLYTYRRLKIELNSAQNEEIEERVIAVVDFLLELEQLRQIPATKGAYIKVNALQQFTNGFLTKSDIQIDWQRYLEILYEEVGPIQNHLKDENKGKIFLRNVYQFGAVLHLLSKTSVRVFVSAMWWIVLHSVSSMGPKPLRDQQKLFKAFMTENKTSEPRQTECINYVKTKFGHAIAYLFATEEKSAENKKKVAAMIENIKDSFCELIEDSKWLEGDTKRKALKKLRSITSYVSHTDELLDPAAIEEKYKQVKVVKNSFYETMSNMIRNEKKKAFRKLFQKNDPNEKPVPNPISLVTSYFVHYNYIFIPIGALGFPYYELGLEVMNYGALGSLIGHEFGHSLDTIGRMFDENGNNVNWWSEKTAQEFSNRAQCYRIAYSKFYFTDIKQNVNADLTLSENIADNIGFKVGLAAYRKYKEEHGEEPKLYGFEATSHEQLYSLAFANIWCANASPEFRKWQLNNDVHAPESVRVTGVALHSPDFADMWNCLKNDDMNAVEKCEIF